VLLKTQLPGGISSYRGVIIVREDSPIQSLEHLRGKRIAMLRTTLAGHLFPMAEFSRRGWLDDPSAAPTPLWVGTHDEVIGAVQTGQADAGAVKDLRLHELEQMQQPKLPLRRLAVSQAVPENALVVRRDVLDPLGAELAEALMKMDSTSQGRAVLEQFGAERFAPCSLEEYSAIYEMSQMLASRWTAIGLPGEPPLRRQGVTTHPSPRLSAASQPDGV
jgi:phosphonate transport system substrate-binding protein